MNFRRILRLIIKELIQTSRDKRMLALLFLSPVFQLFIFGYAVSTDVNNIALAVFDEDRTSTSRELVDRFARSKYFTYEYVVTDAKQADWLLDAGKAQVVLHIPHNFGKHLTEGRVVEIQTLLDGSDSSTARIIDGYVNGVIRTYSGQIATARLQRQGMSTSRLPQVEGRLTNLFNPELKSVFFMVPGVLCLILLTTTMILTSLAIVKEKEIGTLEQLNVTPVKPIELMLGKTVPFLLIGLVEMALVLSVAVFWFRVLVVGSVLLLMLLCAIFLMTSLGLGIFISTMSKTQHEATLTSFFFIMPFILLSGFMFPINNMPVVVQWITYLIPLRYFLEVIRGIFLKGVGLQYLWPQALIMTAFGIVIITLSARQFQKRIS